MQDDKQRLEDLNIEIGNVETQGGRERLSEILAPKLAFQRADGTTIDDRDEFLNKVKTSPDRKTEVESIAFYGNRAVVSCIVTTDGKRFHNLRLFIKQGEDWKLLGWANERLKDE